MTGADVFVLYGMPVVIFSVGFAIYLLADRSARRSEVRINELRRQEAESAGPEMPTGDESESELVQAREAAREARIVRRQAAQPLQ